MRKDVLYFYNIAISIFTLVHLSQNQLVQQVNSISTSSFCINLFHSAPLPYIWLFPYPWPGQFFHCLTLLERIDWNQSQSEPPRSNSARHITKKSWLMVSKGTERSRRINMDALSLSRSLPRSSTKATKPVSVPKLGWKPDWNGSIDNSFHPGIPGVERLLHTEIPYQERQIQEQPILSQFLRVQEYKLMSNI